MSGSRFRLLVAVALVGSITGCSQPATTDHPFSNSPTSSPTKACLVPMPIQWNDAISSRTVPTPPGSRVIPFATGVDPSSFFAELYSPNWSGVVSVAVPSGGITRIAPFGDPVNDQAYAGGFDGRWLVWIVQFSPRDWNDWEISAWDSGSNETFTVATAPKLNGQTISGPIVFPAASRGKAAWVQANKAGAGEAHLFDLTTRRDDVIDTGATYPIHFWGSNLIWQHLDVPGKSGHLEMIDFVSHRQVDIPPALATVHQLAYLAVSDNMVAWTDGHTLWQLTRGEARARLIHEMPQDYFGFIAIAGDFITWDGTKGPAALDTRSLAITSLTPLYGGRFAADNSLLIFWSSNPTGSKTSPGSLLVADVDVSKLQPLGRCVG